MISGSTKRLLLVGLSIGISIFLIQSHKVVKGKLFGSKEAYESDVELARHQVEYLSSYQELIGKVRIPTSKPYLANEWIQLIQTVAGEEKLLLQELKPIRETKKEGGRVGGLFLSVEGRMSDLIAFFYRVAKAEDLVYIKECSLSLLDEYSDTLKAQITLSQV